MSQITTRTLDRILLKVQKPARYVGGEFNSIVKDWATADIKVALAFPDLYDLGMSNMGLTILYHTVNRLPNALAERVYVPWIDMEAEMRRIGLPLYGLESHHPLTDFDILGISLPYEQLFSNVLTLLDLGGLPLRSQARDARYPLVMAGGNAAFNPEPMADFIDFFVLGEGEDIIEEIIGVWPEIRDADRNTQLKRLAQMPGIYVPRFYQPSYHLEDNTLAALKPIDPDVPAHLDKRVTPLMPPPVTRFILPHTNVVFNRASVEIQRGCTRGCRFCHAGMIFRPVRERSLAELLETIDDIIHQTGHEELGLMSLSSSDYSRIGELVQALAQKYDPQSLSIALPSLRLESFSAQLAEMLSGGRKNSFTFAPEAASDRLRNVINKPIPTESLLEAVDAVYQRGWLTIKLYFMIGQPTETDEDVLAIAQLAKKVLAIGEKYHGKRAKVRVGVSTFIPKPHTPFQWSPLCSLPDIAHKQRLLIDAFKGVRGLQFSWNEPQESLLEAVLTRGDRRLSDVIETAWRNGAKFDAWSQNFRPQIWWDAFATHGLDPAWYAHRTRPVDEVFPWDHIGAGVEKRWLLMDWQAAQQGETKIDCRNHCYNCGILTAMKGLRAVTPPQAWKCPPVRNPRWQQKAQAGNVINLTPVVRANMAAARTPDP